MKEDTAETISGAIAWLIIVPATLLSLTVGAWVLAWFAAGLLWIARHAPWPEFIRHDIQPKAEATR